MISSSAPRPPEPLHRRGLLIGVLILLIVLVLATVTILATVPVLHSTSSSFTVTGSGPLQGNFSADLCPVGARALLTYTTQDGREVHFTVFDPSGVLVWSSRTPTGNTTLVVGSCGHYQLGLFDAAGGTGWVNVTLTYWAPTL